MKLSKMTVALIATFALLLSESASNALTYPVVQVVTYPQSQQGPKAVMPYAPGDGAPGWLSIQSQGQGDPVKVQNYWSTNPANNTETTSYSGAGHTPLALSFNPPGTTAAETAAGGCQILDRINDSTAYPQSIYFYSYPGMQHIGVASPATYPNAGPSQILTSQVQYGVRGFMVNNYIVGGADNQSPPVNQVISATYLTGNNNPCAAADQEMGMWQNIAETGRIVYFDLSDHTNCNGLGGCRDNPNGWSVSNPIYQTDEIIQISNAVTYEGTYNNLYYEMYLIPAGTAGSPVTWSPSGYVMRIAVIDGNHTDRFATCYINGSTTSSACTADVPVNWTPARIAQLLNGGSNVVNAVVTPNAAINVSAYNYINGLWMGR
ncbi:MAG TPA: hypothetical protein VFB79_06530 [Candidatus Angelobacter sp.]|nr:hypothetical protein [Candidatus Angelobacter sp.]